MSERLSFDVLAALVEAGEIDTVLVCLVDMQGRLMGKRFHARHFMESAHRQTHCCNYLLATDLEMATPDGYASASWRAGYGDYELRPDLSTLRRIPWLEGTALVLCDALDHHDGTPVPHAPRQVLRRQIERLAEMGLAPMMATELEFFLFEKSYDELRRAGYRDMTPISGYNEDYNIFQTTKEEHVMRRVRNGLVGAGVPVENSKGEAEVGQQELNIRYAGAMDCADHHSLAKHAVKEIVWQEGRAASFLAKWRPDRVGSASHVHVSLWRDGAPAFHDPAGAHGMSETMRHFVAGLIAHAREITFFLAPYVNSYKRFVKGTFAPTRTAWSVDNRTAAFRLCGENGKAVRIECRIGGSDLNPYLAQAALLAAGIDGILNRLELDAPTTGDIYENTEAGEVPGSLREATELLRNSKMLRGAMGEAVIDHYTRCAEWELEEFDRAVTDWEIARGFERV